MNEMYCGSGTDCERVDRRGSPKRRASSGKNAALHTAAFTVLLAAFVATTARPAPAQSPSTTRIDLGPGGVQTDQASWDPKITGDGRYIAYFSYATNLVPGDTGFHADVFVYDSVANTTVRASVDSVGVQGNADSDEPDISSDGRFVVFNSTATNLVPGDTNGAGDIFVHDMVSGTTTRVSVDSSGAQANGPSLLPHISGDGRFVVFESNASNLVPGDTNATRDIFLRDLTLGTTTRVSVDSSGVQGNGMSQRCSISADGRYVVFDSAASNLVPNDTNGVPDVFVHDNLTGTTTRVSVGSGGAQGDQESVLAAISPSGRLVAFSSAATNLVSGDTNGAYDLFLRDLVAGTTARISVGSNGEQANDSSWEPAISGDDRFVAFDSSASNLVPGDTNGWPDVFVRDLATQHTTRVSVTTSGVQGSSQSSIPAISDDGRSIVFYSYTNLVPDDTNGVTDIYVHEQGCGYANTAYCTAKVNSLACSPAISWVGTPSATAGSGFTISAKQELNNKLGLFIYGTNGQQAVPFQGGTLCFKPPLKRTPPQSSGGNPPTTSDCSGTYSIDFNAYIASGVNPALVAGTSVDGQFWGRDPGFPLPNNTSLSDAIHFVICQ